MYLLDTCVISDLVSKNPTPSVVAWVDSIDEERLYLSVLTIGEIKKGIDRLPVSSRRRELEDWLEGELSDRFRGRLVPIDVDVMLAWGALTAGLERAGKRMPAIDSIIAAVATRHALQLVTRNVKDFEDAGIEIIDPWKPEPKRGRLKPRNKE
ncbi:MAG TPA: type II toxin-antitoxin system VapC family toxin [Anaerolineales bacterium]|nr:type II toxin-antitoxin system VapC family toxin [Anaerolineales bacterium]